MRGEDQDGDTGHLLKETWMGSNYCKTDVFFKWRQFFCPNLLIEKKRVTQLINRKSGEDRYNKTTTTREQLPIKPPPDRQTN